jgi:hypothetical protein
LLQSAVAASLYFSVLSSPWSHCLETFYMRGIGEHTPATQTETQLERAPFESTAPGLGSLFQGASTEAQETG